MNSDQIKGKFEQVIGKVKEGIGEAVGDNKTANEGLGDQVKGATRETWGNVKDATNTTTDRQAAETHAEAHDSAADTRHSISNSVENAKTAINERIDEFKQRHG
jgi:uncharacterized protein YjbJ (UPF0337 family)